MSEIEKLRHAARSALEALENPSTVSVQHALWLLREILNDKSEDIDPWMETR